MVYFVARNYCQHLYVVHQKINLELVYLVNILALLRGFSPIRKNPLLNQYLFLRKGRFSLVSKASFSLVKLERKVYADLIERYFGPEDFQRVLVCGADMLSPVIDYRQSSRKQFPMDVVETDSWNLKQLSGVFRRYSIQPGSLIPAGSYTLIMVHSYRIADFEMAEELLNKLEYGKLMIRFDSGNLSGLNQFEKLRMFFTPKKDLLVSTFPFHAESDILLIEKKRNDEPGKKGNRDLYLFN